MQESESDTDDWTPLATDATGQDSSKCSAAGRSVGFQRRRRRRFCVAMVLIAIGISLASTATYGAFLSKGQRLSKLRWVTFGHRNTSYFDETLFAGLWYVCVEGRFVDACKAIADVECSKYPIPDTCEHCVRRSSRMVIPVVIGLLTYIKLGVDTWARYHGDFTQCDKRKTLISTLIGNTNLLFTMVSYWTTCVRMEQENGRVAAIGIGFIFMIVASIIKTTIGLIHLSLPVECADVGNFEIVDGDSTE